MLNNESHCSGPSSTGVTMFMLRWENANGRSGYMPKADRDWEAYLRAKDEDRKKVDRLTRKFRPLTDEVVRGHLVGDHTIGIYPLLQDETCWFLAVDFDKKTWQKDATAFLAVCCELSVPAALERSRSGDGGHVWIFFNRPIPATTARSNTGDSDLGRMMHVCHTTHIHVREQNTNTKRKSAGAKHRQPLI
jgi:hypothetical protein